PFRRTLSWMLVLPLAVPPYLAAYAFGEFFLFTGPVQTAWRALFGFQSARDYWFPDLRSTGGVALVLTCVLYPYVYMTSRVVFLRILLPVARPAIVAGVSLVLMETLNDIGAAEFLGVQTMTTAIFTTWINRSSLEGAAQIAMVMMVLVLALLLVEQWARRRQRFHNPRSSHLRSRPPRVRLRGASAALATVGLALPVAIGFGIPLYVFGLYASRRLGYLLNAELGAALANSVLTWAATAILTVLLGLLLIQAARVV